MFKHRIGVFFQIYSSQLGQRTGGPLVSGGTGGTAEHEGVGQNGGQQQSGGGGVDVHIVLPVHLVDDSAGAADRDVAEVHRPVSFDRADAGVVDDFQYLRLCDALHGLTFFVVVH